MKRMIPLERLRISDNHRYFVTPDGKPFAWLADTVWTMPQRLKWDDAEHLMQRRRAQGFNVLQICALDPERDVEMRTPAGEQALIGGDLSRPNERYFEYLDHILDRAEYYGFYVLLLPVWGQLVVGDDWAGGVYPRIVTEENAYDYACWLGQRYRARSNVLWCLGGDRMPIHKGMDYRGVWRRMAEGLAKGLTGQEVRHDEPSPVWEKLLITYHACHEADSGLCSTFSFWDDSEQWIRFIMLQSGHGTQVKNYELVRMEYERERTMPVWDGEPAYEMMPTCWSMDPDVPRHGPWMVRRRAYWSLLAGAFGYTYGHGSVWSSIGERERSILGPVTWYEALDGAGAGQMNHLRAFMESLRPMTAVPCQQILTEKERREGTLETHAQAAAGEEYVCVYLPSGGSAQLDLRSVWSGECVGVWYWDPASGTFSAQRPQIVRADCGRLTLCTPTQGEEQDWIAVLTCTEAEAPISPFETEAAEPEQADRKVFEW